MQVNILLRVGAAGLQHCGRGHLPLLAAQLLVHLDLDGQAVAVVTGDVRSVEAGHGLRFDDKILQAFVERMAQVDGAIGVRRAVVEKVGGATMAGFAQLVVEAERGPAFQPKRLILRQIGLHRKGGKSRLQLRRWRHRHSLGGANWFIG